MIATDEQIAARGIEAADAQERLAAIESAIRAETNNGFQVRDIRFKAPSSGGALLGCDARLAVGDTVEVSASGVNDGVYTVASADGGRTMLDRALMDSPGNRVTLVRYPVDVVEGALAMLEYDLSMAGKENVASESLSRHSVTYKDTGSGAYPKRLTAFLKSYRKARF